MGAKKETVETAIKGGAKLGLFQKIYKQMLKLYSPAKAREAAEKVYKSKKKTIVDKKVAEFPEKIKKVKKAAIIGGGGLGAADVGGYAITGESPILGPAVEFGKKLFKAKGGSVKKSSSKKSRGTGAAKRGTKFKGVF